MKIDVEGVEFLVLQGGNDTLQNYHPIIFLATHSLALKQQCEALLKSFDYL